MALVLVLRRCSDRVKEHLATGYAERRWQAKGAAVKRCEAATGV
jgi:hypothetical protein